MFMGSSATFSLPTQEELLFMRKHLPKKPGCYIFKDKDNTVLYVGKAISLKNRVNSYWQDRSGSEDPHYSQKIHRLIAEVRNFEVFVVENEMEALILENELIKEHQPPYNVRLKDAKSYPWVQITKEKFPRIRIIRMPERYGLQHKYIGPFVDAGDLKRMLRFIRKVFPYCTCKRCVEANSRKRACVYHQINLCPAPCTGNISKADYNQNITNIEKMLLGYIDPVKKELKTRMTEASESLQFEDAARWRDRLEAIDMFTVNQSILAFNTDSPPNTQETEEQDIMEGVQQDPNSQDQLPNRPFFRFNMPKTPQWKDLDVIAGHYSEKRIGIIIIHVRRGRLLNKTPYFVKLDNQITSKDKYFSSFVKQHYLQRDIPIPPEIVLGDKISPSEKEALLAYFHQQNIPVHFREPQESDKTAGLVRIAKKNIQLLIQQKDDYEHHLAEQNLPSLEKNQLEIYQGLKELQDILDLDSPPSLIEGFDMSHNQGKDYVGSKVALRDGVPDKSQYRRYKIKDPTITASNDIAAMHEVMERRYSHIVKDDEEEPDLIVVDGGMGQLNMAHQLLLHLGLEHIPHIGIAKPPGRSEVYRQPKIVLPEQNSEIHLTKGSPALKLLQLLRDESHRFAITYHRNLQKKRQKKSILDQVSGIGPKRKQKLLGHFKSVKRLRTASVEDIAGIIGPHYAEIVKNFLDLNPEPEILKPNTPGSKKMKLRKKTKKS